MMRKTNNPRQVGPDLAAALSVLRESLGSGERLDSRFTVRMIEIAEPAVHNGKSVRRLRDQLGVSQAVFAKIVGVSSELVEHWEQDVAVPRAIARRLLDEIATDPEGFLKRALLKPALARQKRTQR